MRLMSFFKKFFNRTEVPLTPEQELALREQLRIMHDLDRHGQQGPGTPRTLPRGWDGVGGKAVEKHVWFGSRRT
jgi:hypothetical protein